MNPYAAWLGDLDPVAVMRETPRLLAAGLAGKDPDAPWKPGKWSYRQIVAHLADCEIAFGFRLRQTIAEDNHVMQPFDQDAWSTNYAQADMQLGLATFTALRQWNLQFIDSVPASSFDKPASHPERGPQTFRTVLQMIAGHDRNHLAQLAPLDAE